MDAEFVVYVIALAISGVLLISMAASGFGGQKPGVRVLNGIVGLAMLGYGFYLFFIFDGGTYRIFFYVFLVPFLLIAQVFRNRKAEAEARASQPVPAGGDPAPEQ